MAETRGRPVQAHAPVDIAFIQAGPLDPGQQGPQALKHPTPLFVGNDSTAAGAADSGQTNLTAMTS